MMTKNRFFGLPTQIQDYIMEFHDPFKEYYSNRVITPFLLWKTVWKWHSLHAQWTLYESMVMNYIFSTWGVIEDEMSTATAENLYPGLYVKYRNIFPDDLDIIISPESYESGYSHIYVCARAHDIDFLYNTIVFTGMILRNDELDNYWENLIHTTGKSNYVPVYYDESNKLVLFRHVYILDSGDFSGWGPQIII